MPLPHRLQHYVSLPVGRQPCCLPRYYLGRLNGLTQVVLFTAGPVHERGTPAPRRCRPATKRTCLSPWRIDDADTLARQDVPFSAEPRTERTLSTPSCTGCVHKSAG
jgi:hypothetical protein